MSGRRWLGVVLILAGLGLLAFGAWRLIGTGGGATATTTPTPTLTADASASQTPASQAPTASPTPVPATATPAPTLGEAEVRAFVASLVAAIHAGDVETLLAGLHPATIDRYGQDACRTALAGFTDPTFGIEVLEVQDPAPWDYVTDGMTVTIPDAWAVPGNRSSGGTTVPFTFHFAPFGDAVHWFTDCTPGAGG